MDSKDNIEDNGVGFLYRTMMERDPSKRRVKPVENHLQLLDFADLEDSSDDSDFKIGENEQVESENDDSAASSAAEASEEEAEDPKPHQPTTMVPQEEAPKTQQPSTAEAPKTEISETKGLKVCVGDLIEKAMHRQNQARQRISLDAAKQLKVLICSICLGDVSEENDEIVECDSCGVSVHEGCYGISDSDTVVSTVSSSSTEPWFCDACKAGNQNPSCELCPNSGGIFKETDVGKWVHLVCALYIPGVAFGDVDKLTPVTLFEMPYSRWGAKACMLCEDERYSRTGVCISCDAGMCRNYFHITCAQREGLLSEASTEEDIADPFFAYCKIHADKNIMKRKRQNWLALQSQAREKRLQDRAPSNEKSRVERKLAWHREKYLALKAQKPQPWVPTQKMPRMLTTSPSACKKLLKKAELLGITSQTHISVSDAIMDVRRKWHVPPAFNVEFVSYYLDRNNRMVTMQRQLDELLQQNSELQEQEQILRKKYDSLVSQMEEMRTKNNMLIENGMEFWRILCSIANQKLPMPEVLQPKRLCKSPGKGGKKGDFGMSFILECGICHKSHDQHQLAKCDSCQLHYHLACLDPPLSRMPKKTKSMGWQCSECDKTEEEVPDDEVDTNAPRKLRDHVKPIKLSSVTNGCKVGGRRPGRPRKQPYVALEMLHLEEEAKSSDLSSTGDCSRASLPPRPPESSNTTPEGATRSTRRLLKRKGDWTEDDEKSSEEASQASSSSCSKVPRVCVTRRLSDTRTECCRCKEVGDNSNLVRCDECKRCFHFMCLNPPVKKSPKQRGYTWHCEDCDPSEPEEEEDIPLVKLQKSRLSEKKERSGSLKEGKIEIITLE